MSVRQTKWSTRPGASNNRTNKYREAARLHSERSGGVPSLASRSRDAPPRSRGISPPPCPLLGRCYRNSALLHLVPFASARGTYLLFRIDPVRGSLTRSKASNTNKRAPSFRTERRPAFLRVPFPGTRRRAVEESLRLRALCLDAATGTPRSNPSIADWPRQSALLSSPVPMS
jgi:hypothetical protein